LLAFLVCSHLMVSLVLSPRLLGSMLILDVGGMRVLLISGCIGSGVRA
jgi:hypothetical protein